MCWGFYLSRVSYIFLIFRNHSRRIEGDNCCFCNTSALKLTTNVQDMDLLYASFENKVFQTPFFIALDHNERFIVVAIRGTMSLRDAITDLSAEAKPLDFPGIPPGCKVSSLKIKLLFKCTSC